MRIGLYSVTFTAHFGHIRAGHPPGPAHSSPVDWAYLWVDAHHASASIKKYKGNLQQIKIIRHFTTSTKFIELF